MKSSIFLSLLLASVATAFYGHGPNFSYGVHSVHPLGYAHHGVVAHHGLGHLGYGYGLGLGHLGYGYGLGLGHHIVAAPAEAAEERKKRDIHGLIHHNAAVPVAVGGYVANAGCNGDLCGPTHEVAGLVPALATVTQETDGAVSLTTGAAVHHVLPAVHHVGYAHHGLGYLGYAGHHGLGHLGYGYGLGLGHHGLLGHGYLGHHIVAAPAEERKKREVHIPAYLPTGGYVANAGCNGDLCGPTHEVPGLVPALAPVTQESAGAVTLTTGAAAPLAVQHVVPAVHPVVPAVHHAVPAVGYAGYHGLGYAGLHGLGHLGYAGHHGLGYGLGLGYHGLLGHHGLIVAAPAEAEE